ncbi:GSCOCG00000641001-RA-CDS, partial [Cotesia congregata]
IVPVDESGLGISTLTPVNCNISVIMLSIFFLAATTLSFSPAIVISSF